jgi:hypothetical protein
LIAEQLFSYFSHSISIKTEKFSISLDKDETNIAMQCKQIFSLCFIIDAIGSRLLLNFTFSHFILLNQFFDILITPNSIDLSLGIILFTLCFTSTHRG